MCYTTQNNAIMGYNNKTLDDITQDEIRYEKHAKCENMLSYS